MEADLTPEVRVSPGPQGVAEEAADFLTAIFKDAARERGRFLLAVSGGSTPLPLFRLLASKGYSSKIDWGRVHLFWADERCVPPVHKDSNFGAANDALLSKVPIPKDNVHRIMGELPPDEAARAYEAELLRYFNRDGLPRFDLVLLGLGADGHTASLFPGSDALKERDRLAVSVYVEKLKSHRVTLTLPVINNTANVVFLVTGREKADVVKEVLSGEGAGRYPAGLVRPVDGRLAWLLDVAAAGGPGEGGPNL